MYRFLTLPYLMFFIALTALIIITPDKAASQSNKPLSIQIVTSEYAPFNYLENEKPTGLCTEIVQGILDELQMDVPIQTIPWARAYKMALKQENTLIYTIARTPQRESLFHWAGTLVESKTYLFSLKKQAIQLDSLDQARHHRIGAAREDIRAKYLISKGFLDLDQVVNAEMNAVKLINKRIDLWIEDETAAAHTVRKLGYSPEAILSKSLHVDMGNTPKGYLAFSLNTSPELVRAFSKALEKLKSDGRYDRIWKKYVDITP
ncbi:MAG: amino acid ABC transporter substrate-binding protein [Desulfobacteraceae bacterium]|nr:MAG: amino acid ABC transporter substrate-binding protein [Desulfobacteraceae bacterium]